MVSFGKSDKEKADGDFEKAEDRFEALRYKKAGKYYFSAGETYREVQEFESAEVSFLRAAKSYIEEEMFEEVLESLRVASNSSLELEKYEYANEIFRKGLEYAKKLKSNKKKNQYYVLFSALSYFCYFIQGKPKKGLNLIKKVKKGVNQEFFKDHQLIHLITSLTIALRDKKAIYIDKIMENFKELELNQIEKELIQIVLFLASIQTNLTPRVKFNRESYTTKELIKVNILASSDSFQLILEKPFNILNIKVYCIQKVSIAYSDNLTVNQKPEFPLEISLKSGINLDFVFKPHFQKEETSIGPIRILGKINEKYWFTIENRNKFPLELLSPPAHLDMAINNLKPPLIDTTFPLEIIIENNSESEARDLDISISLPDNLKLMRGTLQKQIYSLRPNEMIEWQISARSMEAGESNIVGEMRYKDPDQNMLEEKKEFPLSIKL